MLNDADIRQKVRKEFICEGHMAAIEKASKVGNFAVSFRAAGEPTSAEERKIIELVNRSIAEADSNRPFEDIERNVIRYGPQVSYPAFAMDKERNMKLFSF
ncbi:hypothetical protein [Photorhabdus luminescens]|uniref:hypothetical protein n=1 Tax=Photorhabdus luminescens TaxID=29488 RepID=UPI0020CFE2F9|nr:hypothetical protein [Photorhabdus luminescens]